MLTDEQVKIISIARAFLKAQPFAGEYLGEEVQIHDAGEFWECWFVRKQPMRPAYGIVAVHKKTGEAGWRPNR